MELRKQKEAEFHDKLRDRELEKRPKEFKYLTSNRKFYSITRKSQKFLKNFLIENCKGKITLDYCCGEGITTFDMVEKGASESVGIDISLVSIETCKKSAIKRGLENKTRFFVMDAENMEFPDDYFDLIICGGVLHHLDINKAYSELARVLKPDGKIICGEPLAYNPIFQIYRRLTPHLRTKWEMEHILKKRDINLAKKYFGEVEKRFFHLATLMAVPFRNISNVFNPLLIFFEFIDSLILRLPLVKWWAWQIVFILSEPKK